MLRKEQLQLDNQLRAAGPRTDAPANHWLRAKLEAARQFLGNKLVTHPKSTFRPRRISVLDEFRSRKYASRGAPGTAPST
jgi:hypothetical protein